MCRYKLITISFILCFVHTITAQNIPHRVPGSPYPFSQIPDTLFIIDDNNFSEAERLTIEIMQGLLAKEKPLIYRDRGVGYSLWLEDWVNNYGIIADYSYVNDFRGILSHFKDKISGYILCNLHDNSSNTAISLCGPMKAIAVTPEHVNLMTDLNINLIYDVREKDENWVLSNYDSLLSTKIMIYQKEEKDLFLGDYSVFSNAFHFFDPISSDLTNTAMDRMDDNSILLGWGDNEHSTVSASSSKSIHVHPADWAANLTTLSNFNANLKQSTNSDTINDRDDVHTVCFVMSDGDNVQWTLGSFITSTKWYGSPNRGVVNLGWTVSPALCELAPTILNYFYQEAANLENAKDYFIAGPSGLGYIFPDKFPAIDSAAALLNRFMAKADLNIVNILGNNQSDKYLRPFLQQENIDALFYYDYSNYSGLAGEIKWINNKPAIGGRYNLWEGFNTPASLASKLNSLPKDSYSAGGYSLIPVHVWSNSVDDVITCANLLDSNVIVVTPDEFVKRIQNKFGP